MFAPSNKHGIVENSSVRVECRNYMLNVETQGGHYSERLQAKPVKTIQIGRVKFRFEKLKNNKKKQVFRDDVWGSDTNEVQRFR